MHVVTDRRLLSEQEFAEIDSQGRYDLVDGELWSSPAYGISAGRLTTRTVFELTRFVETDGGGEVFSAELGFVLDSDGRTILCPDVAYVDAKRIPSDDDTEFFRGAPDLAVEVISESERPHEIQTKVARYLQAGTTLVWCVYPSLQQVVVYHQQLPPRILSGEDELDAEPVISGFQLPLERLFRTASAD